MPLLPVPSGKGGALTGWLSKASRAVVKQPQDAQSTGSNPVLIPMPDGTKWSIEDLSHYIHKNNGVLPPHLQPNARGQETDARQFHHHEGGNNVTYNITIGAPPATPAEPQKKQKSRKRRMAEGTAIGMGRITLWALKTLFAQQQQKQQPPPQPQVIHHYDLTGYIFGHLVGFMMFVVVGICALVVVLIAASGPRFYPVWYDPPPYHSRY